MRESRESGAGGVLNYDDGVVEKVEKHVDHEVVCANCESTHVELFCARCGQKRPNPDADYAIWAVIVAAVERVTQYDGRLLRTLRTLAFHPGQLARDHFDGKRARHVPPFELFVLANVLAWLVVPYLHIYGFSMPVALKLAVFHDWWPKVFAWREDLSGVSHEVFAQRVDAASASVNKLTLLCLVPFFAIATRLVVANRAYRMVQYMIFGVHFYCIHMASVLVGWGLFFIPIYRYLAAHPELSWGHPFIAVWRSNSFAHFSIAPVLFPYLYIALQRAFRLDKRQAAGRAVALTLIACGLLRLFFDVGCTVMLVVA